jgi:hypothetical protein
MLQELAFALFSESLCGNASSFQELQKHSMLADDRFSIGTKVVTHSLSSAEYNDLTGTVAGAAVVKNGVRRMPVKLEVSKDVLQIMALKVDNLTVVETDIENIFRFDSKPHEQLVFKGYYGLFSLINENPKLSTDEEKGKSILQDVFTQKDKMDLDSCPHAQYLVGECYEYGITGILPRDSAKAIEWYRLAAAQGHAGAQCELGYCYHNGESIPQDQVAGVKLYQQAAEQGYAKAQYYMGVASYYGQGVETDTEDPEDYEAAVRWYQLSADQGYAAAQSNLGFCFQVGCGCNLSLVEAEKYYSLAAEEGDAYASAKLGSLKDFMPAIKKET